MLTHPHPAGSPKRRALIVLSSARTLPLREPAGHPGISTGFFLVELARLLGEFEQEYEFTFATPDGVPPQLDVNGLALPFHAGRMLGPLTALAQLELADRHDVQRYRSRHARLVERREADLRLARAHLGRIPGEQTCLSLPELIGRHRDLSDQFSLGEYDFVHMPGGHAPMVDFDENSWMGELLNVLYEQGTIISLICRAPVALTSAKYRITAFGTTQTNYRHPFIGARVTTVPARAEKLMLATGYPKVPDRRTRLTYFADETLRGAGYRVATTLKPAAVKVVWDERRRLLTGNGPQAVYEQVARLRAILREARRAGARGAGAFVDYRF